jgi:hypothetical protein
MGILDVKVYTASGMVINVELQVEISQDLRKRLAFSGAKLLAGQLKRGEEYYQAERVISIVICVDGVLLHEEEGSYNNYGAYQEGDTYTVPDYAALTIITFTARWKGSFIVTYTAGTGDERLDRPAPVFPVGAPPTATPPTGQARPIT